MEPLEATVSAIFKEAGFPADHPNYQAFYDLAVQDLNELMASLSVGYGMNVITIQERLEAFEKQKRVFVEDLKKILEEEAG